MEGGEILSLLSSLVVVFHVAQDLFTECGKWMDGWESRRRRTEGHDWCIIQLGVPGTIQSIEIDTAHFTGNFSPKASVQIASLPEDNVVYMRRVSF